MHSKEKLKGYKLAVVGSRDFDDFDTLVKILDRIRIVKKIDLIVSGAAEGVDSMSEHYAEVNGIPTLILPADWEQYGKSAGFIRNKDIWGNSDIILCIWDGVSKGTKHTIDAKENRGKEMYIYNYIEGKFWKN